MHASAKACDGHAATQARWTAARAEQSKRVRFREVMFDHAYGAFRFSTLAVETSGYVGKEAVQFSNIAADVEVTPMK